MRTEMVSGIILATCLAAVGACYTGADIDGTAFGGGSSTTQNGNVSTTTEGTLPAPPEGGGTGGLPCDVEQVLVKHCTSCHGTPLKGGAKNRMTGYSDLVAKSTADPKKNVTEISIKRMHDATSPMPPDGMPPAADTAILEKWVAGGMPRPGCGTSTAGESGPIPTAPSPYDTPTVCSSNSKWIFGDLLKEQMHPGGACNDCHEKKGKGPIYLAAGTVYPTAHEPDECIGVKTGATVVLTDANGKSVTLPLNASGNFYYRSALAAPFKAKVVANGKTRAMSAGITDGDCNACHTEKGAKDAPGRIMLP